MPINYVGLSLLLVGLALFVAEAFLASYGLLTLGGVVCVVLGGLMLVDSPSGFLRISAYVVVPAAAASALIALFLMLAVVRLQRKPPMRTALEPGGATAVSLADFRREGKVFSGTVRYHGELWTAQSHVTISDGQDVEVIDRRGLILNIKPFGNET